MSPSIEQRLSELEKEIERVKAVNEILNLVHRMQWFHSVNHDGELPNLLAMKTPDVRIYMGSGYWEGPDEVVKPSKMWPVPNPGHMPVHLMSNPIIEIAGDGKTAKGVWMACGMVAMKDPEKGKPAGYWEWNRYAIDFIKEEGKWKLWHHHVYPLLWIGWDDKWEHQFKPNYRPHHEMPEEFRPNHPSTSPAIGYDPDNELPFIPPPEPYETFDPQKMY